MLLSGNIVHHIIKIPLCLADQIGLCGTC